MPYFGERKIAEIDAKDVIAWQNKLMSGKDKRGKPYSADYLKTIHAQLSAIFNHAVKFYNLPCSKGRDIITDPKTAKSNRKIKMPSFLCEEMQDYLKMLYEISRKERIFNVTKSYLMHEMIRGTNASGVKRIRIHDLRHSHVSLLINMGFSVLAIGERVGHEAEKITYRYAHLFPTVQDDMADKLDIERSEFEEDEHGAE